MAGAARGVAGAALCEQKIEAGGESVRERKGGERRWGEKEEREGSLLADSGPFCCMQSLPAPQAEPSALGLAWDAGGIFCDLPAKNNVLGARLGVFSSAGGQKVLLGAPGGRLELLIILTLN